ncbi:hypothetical protein EV424DRAFT_1385205 [Suillus variegatus]|nr:hypothetical protein EV424DRAFT_1385205 [Suillus variegatus]
MNSDAARHPPTQVRRIPPAFFDGVQNGAQSSAAHGTHHCSPARSTRAPLLERLSSLFHHSHWNTDGATELQRRPRRSIFSRGPRIVDVATVQDRKALYVAPRPRPQQQRPLHGQGSSQSQPTATTTSTTPDQGTSTAAPGAATAQSPPIPLWVRFVLFLCCVSPPTLYPFSSLESWHVTGLRGSST